MHCPHCRSPLTIKQGFYRQKINRKYLQRFLCKNCHHKFSENFFSPLRFQKKSAINKHLFLSLCSGVSLRRSALNLSISYNTAYRRFLWMILLAQQKHFDFLQTLILSSPLYLDEMESIEHTKLKPLTIPLIVDQDQRILAITAGSIPAKGVLASISRAKYGKRESQSTELIQSMLNALPQSIRPTGVVSDAKPAYKKLIQSKYPGVAHEVYNRSGVCGVDREKLRELLFLNQQKREFDPLFAINQRCAKLRSDIKRLVRRSWCTTKKVENLVGHLVLYACYNNQVQVF